MVYVYLVLLIIAPQLWFKPLTGCPVDYILYPLWFVVILFSGRIKKFFEFSQIDLFFMVMVVWIILSSLMNSQNSHSTKIIIDYVKFFLIFRFVVVSIPDFTKFKRVIIFLLFLIFILVIESIDHKTAADGLGWVGQPLAWADAAIIRTSGSGRTRWINIFDGPGVFCVLFTIAFPFVVQYFDKQYSMRVKIFAVVSLWFLATAIFFTGSRGGFLASLLCLFAYVISRSKLSFKQLVLASALAALLFMAAPAFLTSVKDSDNSAQNRVDMWMEGVEMTKYNPVFGVGKGNYINYTGKLIAHNSAIEVMGETGLPGFFMWLTLILLSFKSILSFYQSTENLNERSYSIAMAICIIGYIASSMFVTLEYETFYLLLGLAAALGKISGKEITFQRNDFYLVMGIMIGWITMLKCFFMVY